MKKLLAITILAAIAAVFIAAPAFAAPEDPASNAITLKVTFGSKSFTELEYEIVSAQTIQAAAGKMYEVNVGDEKKLGSFRLQVTPTISEDSPGVVTLAVKAWEVRFVTVNGKTEKQYVLFTDQVSKVVTGTTLAASERHDGTDVQVTVTPLISGGSIK